MGVRMSVDVYVFVRLLLRVGVCAWIFLCERVTLMRQARISQRSSPGTGLALARSATSLHGSGHPISVKEPDYRLPQPPYSRPSFLSALQNQLLLFLPTRRADKEGMEKEK